ncbi:MAG: DUF721 domain-containing protein [Bacteroidales bacterium]|jgi:hypothetical protein|nr:DUF721 domain-containing protein [Bacteroidales bacterium]
MKKDSNEHTLQDLMKQMFKDCDMIDKVNEMDVIKTYRSVVGDLISKLTQDIKLSDKTLYVKLTSAALRNELSYKKQDLITRINTELNSEVITSIIFQ